MKAASTKIKEFDLQQFYKEFDEHCKGGSSIEQFRAYCKNLIQNARAPNQQILHMIDTMDRKQLAFTVNNFVMKGHGFGVI